MISQGDSIATVKTEITNAVEHVLGPGSAAGMNSWLSATTLINQAATSVGLDTIANNMAGGTTRSRINALFDAPGWPANGEDGSLATLDLDFANDRYWWDSQRQNRSDLTILQGDPAWDAEGVLIDGTDRLQVPEVDWFNWEAGTLLVEWFREDNAALGCVFSLRGGSGGTSVRVEISVNADRRANFQLIDGGLGNPDGFYVSNNAQASVYPRTNRGRAAMAWEVGETPAIADRGVLYTALTRAVQELVGVSPSEAAIGYRRYDNATYLNGHVKRVTFWPKRFSDGWINNETVPNQSLHMLGDSFVNAAYLQADVAYMLNDDRAFTLDGVGGSSLADQAIRFAGTPEAWSRTLVIMDGGLTDDTPNAIAAIDDITGRLTHDRWIYVEPSPGAYVNGSPERIDWDARVAAIRAHVGEDRFVETLAVALDNGDGSPEDEADISSGIWPLSLREDSIHPTPAAHGVVIGSQIAEKLGENGW